jgi:hypothetical protein
MTHFVFCSKLLQIRKMQKENSQFANFKLAILFNGCVYIKSIGKQVDQSNLFGQVFEQYADSIIYYFA